MSCFIIHGQVSRQQLYQSQSLLFSELVIVVIWINILKRHLGLGDLVAVRLHEDVRHDVVLHHQVAADGFLLALDVDRLGGALAADVTHCPVARSLGEVVWKTGLFIDYKEVTEVFAGVMKLHFPL